MDMRLLDEEEARAVDMADVVNGWTRSRRAAFNFFWP
eukprot:CAMPEP_0196176356 /NCGR_PEP_ID=MMETSP0911-20130528/8659_1 /TAXON_ID=49265 /ORGANISM="Thalassiosira rotula, Strain GSO102" /LENGTH=36 /DNA_ID= /DNA_START= /DNA_END= /DNA_ORIENTATION=